MVQQELYLTEPIHFLRSATVKSNFLAYMSRNNDLTEAFREYLPENLLPYYRHMQGEYILSGDSTEINGSLVPNELIYTKFDTMMRVKSWDTDETIDFTRENLLNHPKTSEWYRIPNTLYFKLCEKYPSQSDLIKNILYPVEDIDAVISAPCFALVQYDSNLLETNEVVSIISAINQFLDYVNTRWAVREFCFEHLYPVVMQDIIWNQLYNCIMTQRILNIRTDSVHSYHVWEYLKSRGLGDYRDVLSTKKALFLYRNIDYILQNQGTRKTFSILMGSLLSDLNVKIQQKALLQTIENSDSNDIKDPGVFRTNAGLTKTSSIQQICKPAVRVLSFDAGDETIAKQARAFTLGSSSVASEMTGNFTENVLAMSNELTNETHIDLVHNGEVETKEELYLKEQESALEYTNPNLFALSTDKQDKTFPYTPNTLLKTKVHEISQKISSDLVNDLYVGYITQAIFYRASLNQLEFAIHVSNGDDIDLWLINGKEAIALMMYAVAQAVGINITVPAKKVWLTHAYLTQFPEIPETFTYCNRTCRMQQYLTEYGFSNMKPHDYTFFSREEMEKALNEEALDYINNYFQLHYHPTGKGTEIFAKVFASRMTYGWYDLNLFEGCETYKEYFDSHKEVKSVIEKYNEIANKANAYEELFLLIMSSMFEHLDEQSAIGIVSQATMNKLKKLFISLCSYNISFVDTTSGLDVITTTTGLCSNELEIVKTFNPYTDARFLPRSTVSTRMRERSNSKSFEILFEGVKENICSSNALYTGHYADDYVRRFVTPWINFTTIRDFTVYYRDGSGLLNVQVLLFLLRSLLYSQDGFEFKHESYPEYQFLLRQQVFDVLEGTYVDDKGEVRINKKIVLKEAKRDFVESCIDWFMQDYEKSRDMLTPKSRVYGGSLESKRKIDPPDYVELTELNPQASTLEIEIKNKLLSVRSYQTLPGENYMRSQGDRLIRRDDPKEVVTALAVTETKHLQTKLNPDDPDIYSRKPMINGGDFKNFAVAIRRPITLDQHQVITSQILFLPYSQHSLTPDYRRVINGNARIREKFRVKTTTVKYFIDGEEVVPEFYGIVNSLAEVRKVPKRMVYIRKYFTDDEGHEYYTGMNRYIYLNGDWHIPTIEASVNQTQTNP